jgi:hypothetical protein
MSKKKEMPRLKIKARIASKVMEKDLIAKAKMLMEDSELILPECAEDCGSCPFRKTRARLEKIARYKDDPNKLAKFAKSGDKLARAYAATIALAHENKTPYLATATYPAGTITYALRGKTPREKLIGVQNFDSSKWRVLSVLDLVNKKGLHFYSYGDNFVCTGRYSRPPQEYVTLAAESVGAGKLDGDTYSCPHNPASIDYMKFDWVSAGKKVLICDQCTAKLKNTLRKLAEGMAVPNVLSEFDISIVRPLENAAGEGDCGDMLNKPISEESLEKYSSGQLNNKDLIEQHMASVHESLSDVKKRIYVKGDKCFGSDMDAFVNEMSADEVERKAIKGILSKVEHPVVVDHGDSVNKLLSEYWSLHGKDALKAVVSEELADKFTKDDDESRTSPLKVIRNALKVAEHDAVVSQIPKYTKMSAYGAFADKVARAFKTSGQSAALSALDAEKSNDHRIRSMTHAFYLALGVTSQSWKFTDEEREYGKHLQPFAKRLLESSETEDHHAAFTTFLREAGSSEDVKRV